MIFFSIVVCQPYALDRQYLFELMMQPKTAGVTGFQFFFRILMLKVYSKSASNL